MYTGIALAIFTGFIIYGGIHRIAKAADQALADGDLAEYQTQVERAQELIGRALELRN